MEVEVLYGCMRIQDAPYDPK